MKKNDGKDFELLIQKIQQELAPTAKVTHNEKIKGKSGAQNQVDVCLRGHIAQYPFFCIIECKDWQEKVGIETIRGFKTKIFDVGAHRGVMVSRKGFTSEASILAKSEDIILYTLVDANSEDWKNIPLIPIRLIHIQLGSSTAKMVDEQTNEPVNFQHNGEIFDKKLQKNFSLEKFLESRWDQVFETREPNKSEIFSTASGEIYYKQENILRPVILTYSLVSQRVYLYGSVAISEGFGFLDQENQFVSPGYKSTAISLPEVYKTWPKTDDENKIPNKAVITILIGKYFTERSNPAPKYLRVVHSKENSINEGKA
ncbi:MAG: restriction endonuclease [Alphaproteobacteria bacterium]|nr:restriction endonuclease [Alphaproteobacteria bacterium]